MRAVVNKFSAVGAAHPILDAQADEEELDSEGASVTYCAAAHCSNHAVLVVVTLRFFNCLCVFAASAAFWSADEEDSEEVGEFEYDNNDSFVDDSELVREFEHVRDASPIPTLLRVSFLSCISLQ